MSNPTPNLPGPESLAGRILAYFKRNRDEEFTRAELARTYDTSAGAITHAVDPLLAAGWLSERSDEQGNRVLMATAALARLELTPGTNLANAIGAVLSPRPTQRRKRLPPLDPAHLAVKTGDLAQPRLGGRSTKGQTVYAAVFDKLIQPNSWVEVDSAYVASMHKALTIYRKANPSKVLRLVRVSDTHHHLQRLEDKA